LAFFDGSQNDCDVSKAPSLHITGFKNTSLVCIEMDYWANASLVYNGTSRASMNFTTSNVLPGVSPNASYTDIWYQQLSGNTTQDRAKDSVGTLVLGTYPCPGCGTSCSEEQGTSIGGGATILPLTKDEWLQWSCNAEGACYNLQYTLRSFSVRTAVDNYNHLDSDEQNNKCMLAAVTTTNATMNNNTDLHPGKSAGVSLRYSMIGIWTAACIAACMAFWI